MKRLALALVMMAMVAVALSGCDKLKGGKTALKPNAVKLEFYVMSQCPYGVQVENAIKPALDQLTGYVDFSLNFIVTEAGPGDFKSLHGPAEVEGDILQLCAAKLSPTKYMDFVACQNENVKDIQNNYKACAQKVQIDVAALDTCKGKEGKDLLSASAKAATAAKAQGSPTIKMNGADYQGGRGTNDFMRAICTEIKGDKPEACKKIPEPVKVAMTILNDNRCADCVSRADRLIGRIKSTFPGLEVKKLDYMTPEGKALYKDSGVKFLPAFLFDDSVEKDKEGFQQFGRWLEPAGKFKNLKAGSQFDPTAEICDNKVDDNGDGKVDCDDSTCAGNVICRKEIPKRLDLFVMSQCPYGIKALNAMDEVLKNFKGSGLEFHVNYIASKEADGFKSLHGQGEVDEDIRELCAMKYFAKDNKFMDYINCRNKDIKGDWAACTGKETKIDKAKIEKCSTGDEGKKLLEENIKLGNELQINASPTWLANNKKKFSGIDAESVRKNVCDSNAGMKGCDKTLSGTNNTSSGSAPACGK